MRNMVLAVAVLGGISPAFAQQTTCSATMSAFSELREGMSYAQAVSIIGCSGSLMSSSEMSGFKTEMFMWSGSGTLGANMNAMFQNNQLVIKSQFGLQ